MPAKAFGELLKPMSSFIFLEEHIALEGVFLQAELGDHLADCSIMSGISTNL